MRALLGCILVLSLAVSPALAGTNDSKSNTASATAAGDSNTGTAVAATGAATPGAKAAAKPDTASIESEIEELRDLMETQSRQIQDQNDQMKLQQQKMAVLEDQLKAAKSANVSLSASPAAGSASTAVAAVSNGNVEAGRPLFGMAAPGSPAAQGSNDDAPLQFRIGSAYITPIGFMDFTGVGRTTNAGNGIGSNFGSIPYGFTTGSSPFAPNPLTDLTEARFSIQNSRIGFRVDALAKGAHVIGYMEADFLGNNAGSVAVTSNSNTLRSRLYWVDVTKGKWEFLGGQTWSLITPGRVGISPLPGNVFYTQDTDVNYNVGLVWGRIPEFRLVYHPTTKAAIAIALDQTELYDGGSGGGGSIVVPTGAGVSGGVSGLVGTQLNNGTTTVNAPEVFPDVIVKAAFDPVSKFHVEFGGVERQFRVAVNSTTSTTSPLIHQTATGGGAFINGNLEIFKGFRLFTNNYWSEGGGRYIFGLAPDVVISPNGKLTDLMSSSTLDGFEYTHKSTTIYAYYGAVYIDRAIALTNGLYYGYGVPATGAGSTFSAAISQNRTIQEPTIGFNQTIWRDSRFGALNVMGQYAYLLRDPWSVAPGAPTHASLSIAFVNLRYTLPGMAPATSSLR